MTALVRVPERRAVVRILLASPSDVAPERDLVAEVVAELNDTLGGIYPVHLELVRWETHSYPSMGPDAQSVVNQQLGDDFAIFLGIFWMTLGTETPRAPGGAVEEFWRAIARLSDDPESVRIMMYFKETTPAQLSDIDLSGYGAVRQFKQDVRGKGTFTWDFSSLDELRVYVRKHLSRQIRDVLGEAPRPLGAVEMVRDDDVRQPVPEERDDEEAFLDLVLQGTDAFERLTEVGERMSAAIQQLGLDVTRRSEQLTAATDRRGAVDVKAAKRAIDGLAADMTKFADLIDADLPLFSACLESGASSWGRAASLWESEFQMRERRQIEEATDTAQSLAGTLRATEQSITGFREIVANLPRLTAASNRAKRRVLHTLDRLVEEIDAGFISLDGVAAIFGSLHERTNATEHQST